MPKQTLSQGTGKSALNPPNEKIEAISPDFKPGHAKLRVIVERNGVEIGRNEVEVVLKQPVTDDSRLTIEVALIAEGIRVVNNFYEEFDRNPAIMRIFDSEPDKRVYIGATPDPEMQVGVVKVPNYERKANSFAIAFASSNPKYWFVFPRIDETATSAKLENIAAGDLIKILPQNSANYSGKIIKVSRPAILEKLGANDWFIRVAGIVDENATVVPQPRRPQQDYSAIVQDYNNARDSASQSKFKRDYNAKPRGITEESARERIGSSSAPITIGNANEPSYLVLNVNSTTIAVPDFGVVIDSFNYINSGFSTVFNCTGYKEGTTYVFKELVLGKPAVLNQLSGDRNNNTDTYNVRGKGELTLGVNTTGYGVFRGGGGARPAEAPSSAIPPQEIQRILNDATVKQIVREYNSLIAVDSKVQEKFTTDYGFISRGIANANEVAGNFNLLPKSGPLHDSLLLAKSINDYWIVIPKFQMMADEENWVFYGFGYFFDFVDSPEVRVFETPNKSPIITKVFRGEYHISELKSPAIIKSRGTFEETINRISTVTEFMKEVHKGKIRLSSEKPSNTNTGSAPNPATSSQQPAWEQNFVGKYNDALNNTQLRQEFNTTYKGLSFGPPDAQELAIKKSAYNYGFNNDGPFLAIKSSRIMDYPLGQEHLIIVPHFDIPRDSFSIGLYKEVFPGSEEGRNKKIKRPAIYDPNKPAQSSSGNPNTDRWLQKGELMP